MKTKRNGLTKPAGERALSQPTGEDIARRAAAIWEQEGRPNGRNLDHWLRAEAQLRQGLPCEAIPS